MVVRMQRGMPPELLVTRSSRQYVDKHVARYPCRRNTSTLNCSIDAAAVLEPTNAMVTIQA
jgi:hypothetical protein